MIGKACTLHADPKIHTKNRPAVTKFTPSLEYWQEKQVGVSLLKFKKRHLSFPFLSVFPSKTYNLIVRQAINSEHGLLM